MEEQLKSQFAELYKNEFAILDYLYKNLDFSAFKHALYNEANFYSTVAWYIDLLKEQEGSSEWELPMLNLIVAIEDYENDLKRFKFIYDFFTPLIVEWYKNHGEEERATYLSNSYSYITTCFERLFNNWMYSGICSDYVPEWFWIWFHGHDLEKKVLSDNLRNKSKTEETLRYIMSKMNEDNLSEDNSIESPSTQEDVSNKNKTTFTVSNLVSFTMIRVDGGSFRMGGFIDDEDSYPHERPRHDVSVSPFLIGETQVTQELWEAVMGGNPSQFKGKNKPVESVSWNDCVDFIHKLNELTGKHFRLPTEAEWEFAARGGRFSKNYTFSGSNDRNEVAWQPENSGHTTHEVKTKKPNELGIFDMSGNVLEWVDDWFGEYPDNTQTDPTGPSYGRYKVLRGGSWYNPSSFCRVSFRNYMEPECVNFMYGFRLAL